MCLAPNTETLKIILGRRPANVYLGYPGAGGSFAAPSDEIIKFISRAFRYCFN